MTIRKSGLSLALLALAACALHTLAPELQAAYSRTIAFSGYTWQVKTSNGRVGPGPNYFSDAASNVWTDTQGRLHMVIQKSRNKWLCSEVISSLSFGHGTYRFYLDSPVDNLDKNVVLGLFTWNDAADYAHREIDIEFSRWGNAADPTNGQYVVQPYDTAGHLTRIMEPANQAQSTHSFSWSPTQIGWLSLKGLQASPASPGDVIAQWTFSKAAEVPQAGGENARINLWLYQGRAPSNGQRVELVINKFEFVP